MCRIVSLLALTLNLSFLVQPAHAAQHSRKPKKSVSFKKSVKHFHKYLRHTNPEERKYLSSDERKRDVESMRMRDEGYLKSLWKLSARSAKDVCRQGISREGIVSESCLRAQTQKIDVGRVLFEKHLAKRGVNPPSDMNRALASE